MSEQNEADQPLICHKCRLPLENTKPWFAYLGRIFHAELPVCPGCGLIFVPQDLVEGRMQEVEIMPEDK